MDDDFFFVNANVRPLNCQKHNNYPILYLFRDNKNTYRAGCWACSIGIQTFEFRNAYIEYQDSLKNNRKVQKKQATSFKQIKKIFANFIPQLEELIIKFQKANSDLEKESRTLFEKQEEDQNPIIQTQNQYDEFAEKFFKYKDEIKYQNLEQQEQPYKKYFRDYFDEQIKQFNEKINKIYDDLLKETKTNFLQLSMSLEQIENYLILGYLDKQRKDSRIGKYTFPKSIQQIFINQTAKQLLVACTDSLGLYDNSNKMISLSGSENSCELKLDSPTTVGVSKDFQNFCVSSLKSIKFGKIIIENKKSLQFQQENEFKHDKQTIINQIQFIQRKEEQFCLLIEQNSILVFCYQMNKWNKHRQIQFQAFQNVKFNEDSKMFAMQMKLGQQAQTNEIILYYSEKLFQKVVIAKHFNKTQYQIIWLGLFLEFWWRIAKRKIAYFVKQYIAVI